MYGRRNVLQSTNLIFLVFNLSCGFTKTQAQYCIMRFLAGLFGSAPLAIGGGVISDMFEPHDRGRAISWYSLAPMLAPCVGPITSGWIVEKNVSWRWIHWMWTAFGALVASIGLIVLAETYQPRLLELKRNRLAKETGNHALFTEYTFKSLSPKQRIAKALVRPVLMLSSEIILLLIALAMLFVYGLLYLVLATFTVVFERSYNESVGIAGINYVSLALGYTAGGQIGGRLMDKIYLYLRARNGGESVPEHKLPLSLSGGLFLVVGMIIYGWAAEKHFHWIVPNIGAFLFAFGNIQCFLSFMNVRSTVFSCPAPWEKWKLTLTLSSFSTSSTAMEFSPRVGWQLLSFYGLWLGSVSHFLQASSTTASATGGATPPLHLSTVL